MANKITLEKVWENWNRVKRKKRCEFLVQKETVEEKVFK